MPAEATQERVIPHAFWPRRYQRRFMAYLDGGGKRAVWCVHRRGGKDLTAMHQTAKMALRRRGAYWHVFPTGEQARKAIWEGFTRDGERVMEQVFPSWARKRPRAFLPNSEMVVELKNGSMWRLLGSDRVEVVGAGPVGVTFSEFALAKPSAWNLIRPMLRENEGWASFISTPRGPNHFKALFDMAGTEPGWFRERLTLYDTRAFDPDKTLAEERAEGMPEALIRQEYLCDWTAALVGSVWGDLVEALEKKGAVCEFEQEHGDVFTSWDLGLDDATAIWFWQLHPGGGVDVLGHYEAHGQPLSHYFDELDRLSAQHGWRYVRHWLPHDARQHTLAAGTSVLNQCMERWGQDKVAICPSLSLLDGIQAGRWLMQQPVRFHVRCKDGIEALRHYRWAWDEDKKVFSEKPIHDWSSHSADGWRYVAIVVKASEVLTRKPAAPKVQPIRPAAVTLDRLWAERDAQARRRGAY
jgi:hypothetical protein